MEPRANQQPSQGQRFNDVSTTQLDISKETAGQFSGTFAASKTGILSLNRIFS